MEGHPKRLMVSRRALIAGAVAATAAGRIEATVSPRARIHAIVTELLSLMHELHGGRWLADVDHDLELIMLTPAPTNPPPPPAWVIASWEEDAARHAADPLSVYTLRIG